MEYRTREEFEQANHFGTGAPKDGFAQFLRRVNQMRKALVTYFSAGGVTAKVAEGVVLSHAF